MRNLFILIFLAFQFPVFGQQSINTSFATDTWQSSLSNPAWISGYGLTIGLPSVYNDFALTAITYNDLIEKNAEGETVVNIDKGISLLEEQNFIREKLSFNSLYLGFNSTKWSLNFMHQVKFNAYINYPRTLAQLIWQGNAQFIGQTIDFGPDLQLSGYHELSIGFAYKLTDFLTIGIRGKHLSGIADISSDKRQLSLHTDDQAYDLTVNADYRINNTGQIQYDGFQDLAFDYDFGRLKGGSFLSANSGWAVDLGLNLHFGKLDIGLSAIDIGKINWDKDVNNYSLEGAFEYKGLDAVEGIFEDSVDIVSVLDTLESIYEFQETNDKYSNDLPALYYLNIGYQLNEKWRLSALAGLESYRQEEFITIGLGANVQVLNFWNLGLSYAYRDEVYDNVGFNSTLELGPMQLLLATDNLLTAFRVADSRSANFRVGLTLGFGNNKPLRSEEIENQNDFFRN